MWLNGFNDNLPGFPKLPCKYIPCTEPYMGPEQPGTPVDPGKALQGPYGTGLSGPIYGQCPVDRDWIRESSGDPSTGSDWIKAPPQAPKHRDDTDSVMSHLAMKKINAFSNVGHGFYFWNFRTDVYEPTWSYMAALDRGWIPKGNLMDDAIVSACHKEDQGAFLCIVQRSALEPTVKGTLQYCLEQDGRYDEIEGVLELSGDELFDKADEVIGGFWSTHRSLGATCDFGGIATLVELNKTFTDESDDWPYPFDDDSYIVYVGPKTWLIVCGAIAASLLGSIIGFVIAMRYSKGFNKKVRQSVFFQSIPLADSKAVRKSLNLIDGLDYESIPDSAFD